MDMMSDGVPPPKAGWWMKLLIKIAGVDEETLRGCPLHDWENVRAVGEIMICTLLYQSGLFALILHRLFAAPGQIRPELVLVSMFIATFIMFIDSYMVMRSGWHIEGIKALLHAGLEIAGGTLARIKSGIFLSIRIGLSIGLAQLTAIFVSLLIFAGDINAKIHEKYLTTNAHLIGPATTMVDAAIQRATDAATAQTKLVNNLAAEVAVVRQNEIDPLSGDPQIRQAQEEVSQLVAEKAKAEEAVQNAETFAANEYGGIKGDQGNSGVPGYGLRYRAATEQIKNARLHTQNIDKQLDAARSRLADLRKKAPVASETTEQRTHNQLSSFQGSLNAENDKLSKLKDELAKLIEGREDAIRKAIERAPDHVGLDDGFLTQIAVLERIAQEDRKIAAIILLIDLVSFGFELAAVLAKVTSYVPTTYSALLASGGFMRVVEIVEDMTGRLKDLDDKAPKEPEDQPSDKPLDGLPGESAAAIPEPPPKRKRGRPRKHPLPPGTTGANGQGNSEAA
jgi:hypothetical protein